ncbi:MAG: flippase-like domain-containing protein [Phycisphaerae bacterium]|nr:flippase-like domain-containing protein [Phycisphaerae bacterium]NIR64681.1 flippase-like domain-containing protein [candidate division Zixibacteria bacterium]NIP51944.1 flippase-like domain-containing protein [Phycisphaerae bacterium]NIS51065.1 flippase-like domain-containing protein [Phycisphaerae bacterium]NIU08680.1 flippase-like domain-containing protein [Phycisphaerae bacterium]
MPDDREPKKSRSIFLFIRIAVVSCGIIAGIYWISKEVGWDNLANTFRSINLGIFALVLGVFIIAQIIIGLRWWILLRSQSIFIRFWAAVRLYLLGWFYNNFMPGSVGGDLLRAWYVTKHTDKKFEAVLSVFVDRVIGLSSTLVIAVFFYLLFLRGKGLEITYSGTGGFVSFITQYKSVFFWGIVIIILVLCVLLLHKKGRSILLKACLYIHQASLRLIIKFRDAIVIYCKKPLSILVAFGLTVFLQMLTITAFWLLGRNIGIQAGVKYYYVFFTLTWVLGAVPVSIGGIVVVEGMLALMFIKFAGTAKDAASTLVLCQRAVWMLASLPGAVIHLIGAHLPGEPKNGLQGRKDFFVDSKSPVD